MVEYVGKVLDAFLEDRDWEGPRGRLSSVNMGDYTLLVGYGWAVYAVKFGRRVAVYAGWFGYSDTTNRHLYEILRETCRGDIVVLDEAPKKYEYTAAKAREDTSMGLDDIPKRPIAVVGAELDVGGFRLTFHTTWLDVTWREAEKSLSYRYPEYIACLYRRLADGDHYVVRRVVEYDLSPKLLCQSENVVERIRRAVAIKERYRRMRNFFSRARVLPTFSGTIVCVPLCYRPYVDLYLIREDSEEIKWSRVSMQEAYKLFRGGRVSIKWMLDVEYPEKKVKELAPMLSYSGLAKLPGWAKAIAISSSL